MMGGYAVTITTALSIPTTTKCVFANDQEENGAGSINK
jgi:hypothetical protein